MVFVLAFLAFTLKPDQHADAQRLWAVLVYAVTGALLERHQRRHVEYLHQPAVQADDAQCAQASDGTAHGFQAQAQVRGHVLAGHAQHETMGRVTAADEAPGQPHQEAGQALFGGKVAQHQHALVFTHDLPAHQTIQALL